MSEKKRPCDQGDGQGDGAAPGSRLQKNIVLTGFMGSGKTSVGRELVQRLGLRFYDTDDEISREEGMSIPRLFETRGEAYFRRREAQMVQKLAQEPPGTCVISTGGGVVMREENRTALRRSGILVFLDVPAEEVYRRLADKGDRPLLQVDDPLQTIEKLMEERRPFYLQADLHVDAGSKTPGQLAEEIMEEAARLS